MYSTQGFCSFSVVADENNARATRAREVVVVERPGNDDFFFSPEEEGRC